MPIPIPRPGGTGASPTAAPQYYVRQPQDWAVEQERARHDQALYLVGEWAVFVLLWHEIDFRKGLVTRCSRCYDSGTGTVATRIANVYNQPTQNRCPDCYGTTFQGGYRARIVRPGIFTDTEETERQDRRGSMHPNGVTISSTSDFRTRAGDYVFRGDGSRWQLGTPQRVQLRTGFEHPSQDADAIAYEALTAKYEEPTSVAYLIPPDNGTLRITLHQPMRYPGDFSSIEDIRGVLMPMGTID